jgi:hypothetical protein
MHDCFILLLFVSQDLLCIQEQHQLTSVLAQPPAIQEEEYQQNNQLIQQVGKFLLSPKPNTAK